MADEMLLLMDEAGDPGMKLGRGSSDYFTVAMVLFHDLKQAAECKERIDELRAELGVKKTFEFHFTDRARYREEFLKTVALFPFRYCACILDKQRLSGKAWHKKDYVYQQVAVMALHPLLPELRNAKLLFDATSGKAFDQELLRFVKKHAGYREKIPAIKNTQRVESHKDNLIQLADMVCGAVHRSVQANKRGAEVFRKLIQEREEAVRLFPSAAEETSVPVK